MTSVIFACVHNAGRSQMAAAWFNELADPAKAHALSAGTEPGERVHPEVLAAMKEVGVDLSQAKPQLLTRPMIADARRLVTMGCGEACPVAPHWVVRDDWPLEDPKGKPIERVREIRDDIRLRIEALVREQGWGRDVQEHEVTIRAARDTDFERVVQLARAGELLEHGIAEGLSGFLVAECRGAVIGACGLEEYSPEGLLRTVAVDAGHRRLGIGRMLTNAALGRARERALGAVYLLTTRAADYFAKLGFAATPRATAPRTIRESWEFRTGCPSSAILMMRPP